MNTEIKFGHHTIKVEKEEAISQTNLHASVVSITPGVIDQKPFDIMIGIGEHLFDARRDAFERSKAIINLQSDIEKSKAK